MEVDLHLNGNISSASSARKRQEDAGVRVVESIAAVAISIAFHERFMLPFYDWCLKGARTSYVDEPPVRYFSPAPKLPREVGRRRAGARGHIVGPKIRQRYIAERREPRSIVGGRPRRDRTPISRQGRRLGAVGFGPDGRPTARRVLTFCSAPLTEDLDIAGPIKLVLFASSSRTDTDFVVKLSEQMAQSSEERGADRQPQSRVVTKGWLRASHRAIDRARSLKNAPWYTHTKPSALKPGKVYRFEIAVMPTAYRFKRGNRIRLEIANTDSQFTELVFHHAYAPEMVGADLFFHDAKRRSHIILPVIDATAQHYRALDQTQTDRPK